MSSTLFLASLVIGWVQSKSNYLSGKHFRIGFNENPYGIYTEVNDRNETVLHGFYVDMLEWMSVRGNFTYSFVLTEYTGFNNLPATFSSNKLDWYAASFALAHGRNYLAHYMSLYDESTLSIVIPYPRKEANLYSVVLPYTTSVWACFFAAIAAMSFLLRCFARAKKQCHRCEDSDPFQTYGGAILYVVGVATNQGATCFSKARSVKFLAGVWCLAALVIVNAYSSSLITFMTNPHVTPLIKSIYDIANKSAPQILIFRDSYFRALVEDSLAFEPFRENTLKMPRELCGDPRDIPRVQQCLETVKEGGHVFVLDTWAASDYMDQDFRKMGSCSFSLAPQTLLTRYGAWVMALNSPHELRNALDVLLLELVSFDIYERMGKAYFNTTNFCSKYKTFDQSLRKLSLKDVASAFIILAVGTAISLAAFAYEVLRSHVRPKAAEKVRKTSYPVANQTSNTSK